ncbi:MAG: arabinogalactan endo-1,4-beta-galactosidase [Anaerolineae bacterium]|nr:arabinogalactan endo-1,4-beta-galactosidase [Anaerolineae bacterium]
MKPKLRLLLSSLLIFTFLLSSQPTKAADPSTTTFYRGVDLSYVNEMEDCGATYRVNGEPRDPYQLFADYGANLVRVRLWHSPTWTKYSTLDDVIRSLKRAKALGLDTLLDFHNSDTWADPSKQIIPAAWANITDVDELAQTLHDYIYDTLMQLDSLDLLPTIVQVGNEINSEILRPENSSGYPINWQRNATLINAGIRGVRDAAAKAGSPIRVMLHIAQPEEVEGWLLAATEAGVSDFDIVGVSYYKAWSSNTIKTVGNVINKLTNRFGKDVLIAETGYPWTLESVSESASNIPNQDFLLDGYPATPEGQKQYLIDLTQTVFASGGIGVIYWEPAWVSTRCHTLWGQGSHWENATFFDFKHNNEVLPAIEFLNFDYTYPVDATLRLNADNLPDQIYFRGDFTGLGKRPLPITPRNGEYIVRVRLLPGTTIHYQFYSALPASTDTAIIKGTCVDDQGQASITLRASSIFDHGDGNCP